MQKEIYKKMDNTKEYKVSEKTYPLNANLRPGDIDVAQIVATRHEIKGDGKI